MSNFSGFSLLKSSAPGLVCEPPIDTIIQIWGIGILYCFDVISNIS